jgi:long-chain acyl-CoA synthetase
MNSSHKLEALVYLDLDQAKADKVEAELESKMEENRKEYNDHAAAFETLLKIHIHEAEFEKTPKRSIKRFLYKLEE